jgi:hypothetical protein
MLYIDKNMSEKSSNKKSYGGHNVDTSGKTKKAGSL